MRMRRCLPILLSLALMAVSLIGKAPALQHKKGVPHASPQLIIFDTDIGDDIDDAYALALLLQSPGVKILGVTTAFGDTHLRARLVSRLLQVTGNQSIPVCAGPPTHVEKELSQAEWARQFPDRAYPSAVDFILQTIRRYPGRVTLLSVAPETNIGALLAKDPTTFRKLKRVVIMGGSLNRGYGDAAHPDPEWNIVSDVSAAQALFTSGVPLYVMPLDSTQILLDKARRETIYRRGSTLTDALEQLTKEWSAATGYETPTLFDAMATAYALRPELCPVTPMRIVIDLKGFTRRVEGRPNANVCLQSDAGTFFDFYLPLVTR